MKDVFLVFDTSCFYEIIILNYFLQFTKSDVILCSLDGQPIRTMEGYTVSVDMALSQVDTSTIRSFILPGGNISSINQASVHTYLQNLKAHNILIGAICAGVDVLEEAGILAGLQSTHNTAEDIICDQQVITARANTYVDFAIAVAKALNLFSSEADLEETIAFWKYHKAMQ